MKVLVLIIAGIALTSCATMFNDKHQKINVVSSNNTEIKGSIGGVPFTGPGIVTVERAREDKIILVEGNACTKQTVLNSSVDTTFWINIFSSGPFGSSTDYSSEKMWKYQDTVVIPCK